MSRGQVHNALGRGILPSALTRAVGDAEGSSGLERYGETLTPTLNLWAQAEWLYLRREWPLSLQVTSGAVAGEFSGFALINPVGSGVLAVIEMANFWSATATAVWLRRALASVWSGTYATSAGVGVARDSRLAQAMLSPGICEVIYGSDAASVGVALAASYVPALTPVQFMVGFPYVLSPGEGLSFQGGTVNVGINGTLVWRERKAFPGELE